MFPQLAVFPQFFVLRWLGFYQADGNGTLRRVADQKLPLVISFIHLEPMNNLDMVQWRLEQLSSIQQLPFGGSSSARGAARCKSDADRWHETSPATYWDFAGLGQTHTFQYSTPERLKLRQQMAAAPGKKSSASLTLFMEVNDLEVEEELSTMATEGVCMSRWRREQQKA